jgi:antidote-toxin recognition MazE-like antitoxin
MPKRYVSLVVNGSDYLRLPVGAPLIPPKLESASVTCNNGEMASAQERVRQHRQRLRAQGLRPIQIWVPDVRAPEFAAEAHRQSAAIAASEQDRDDQAFVDAITVDWDEAEHDA